jgi:hypothetical protein
MVVPWSPPRPPPALLPSLLHTKTNVAMITPPVIFYKRFIDNVFGVWLPPATNAEAAWEAFQLQMNNYHGLKWIFSDLSDTINFMDLRLSLINGHIHSSLYERALNHHLYIPPHSAHPPGVTLGLIYGLVFRIVTLCSDEDDILSKSRLAFWHLRQRGYAASQIIHIFHAAII